MKNKYKTVLIFLALAVIIFGAYFTYNSLSKYYKLNNTPESTSAGESSVVSETETKKIAAPDFTVYDIDGNAVKLSEFIGKPIVLNFWASWCPPCKSELPDFDKVYNEMKDDVVFLMVDLADGKRETVAKGSAYIAEQGYSFSVYYDTTQEAANTYGISSIPTTYFIDKDGNIAGGQTGMLDEEGLREGISKINQ
jgi:thiol-disulfide isomerase/thioredoxin